MQKVFREGKDIHTATAAEIFEVAEEKVTKEHRRYLETASGVDRDSRFNVSYHLGRVI